MKKIILSILLIILLSISLISCGNENKTDAPKDEDTTAPISLETSSDEDFDNAKKILKTEADLDYAILTTLYYYNENGEIITIKQSAVYNEESKANYDFAAMQSMEGYFSEYEQDGLTLNCTVSESAIEQFFQNSDYDSVIKNAESNSLKYEILK